MLNCKDKKKPIKITRNFNLCEVAYDLCLYLGMNMDLKFHPDLVKPEFNVFLKSLGL